MTCPHCDEDQSQPTDEDEEWGCGHILVAVVIFGGFFIWLISRAPSPPWGGHW